MSPRVKPRSQAVRERAEKLADVAAVPGERATTYTEFRSRERAGHLMVDREDILWKYLTTSPARPNGDPREMLEQNEQRVLSKATGAAGGYLVPTDLEAQILSVVHARGSIGPLAREIVTESGTALNLSTATAHGSAAWTAESAAFVPSDETFGLLALGAFKAATKVIVSEELAADEAVDFGAYLAEELGARIVQLEATAFVLGDGAGKPLGAQANLTQLAAATGSSTTFTLADLVNALHTVAPNYRDQNGAWVMSDGALKALRNLKDSADAQILFNAQTPGATPMLLGYPIYVDESLPAPAANAKSLMFAGWNAAYVVRRVAGIGVQRQDELHSDNGQLGFRSFHRVDGRVAIAAAGVTLQHSAT